MEEKRHGPAFAIIPGVVLANKELNNTDKVVFAVIAGLTRQDGYCWASNAYLATVLGMTNRRMQMVIEKLEKLNIVRREIENNENRRIYVCVIADVSGGGGVRNKLRGGTKNTSWGDEANFVHKDKIEIDILKPVLRTGAKRDDGEPVETEKPQRGREDINWLVAEFERIRGFKASSSKDRRFAAHLLRNFSQDQLTAMLTFCEQDEFAPRVGSLEKLWYKRGDVIAGIKAMKTKSDKNSIRVL